MRVIVEFRKGENSRHEERDEFQWLAENIIEIERHTLRSITDKICQQCRYPLLALRLLIYVITGIDNNGRIDISARQLSKKLGVHYDTVTKCLKYLREIGVMRIEK